MKPTILAILVFALGCTEEIDTMDHEIQSATFADSVEPAETFDIRAYIEEHCVQAPGRRFFTIDPDFTDGELEVILSAVDHANEVLGARIEVCGVYDAALYGGGFIRLGDVNDGTAETWVGSYSDSVLTLYPDRVRHNAHLRKVLLHELGHYFGAPHSTNSDDIMASGWNGVSDYSAADVETIGGLI